MPVPFFGRLNTIYSRCAPLLVFTVGLASRVVYAQASRLEVTPTSTTIRFLDFNPYYEFLRQAQATGVPSITVIDPGVGVRVGYSQNSAWMWEAVTALFPRFATDRGGEYQGGAKLLLEGGGRYRHRITGPLSLAGVMRVGFIDFARAPQVFASVQGPNSTLTAVGEAERKYLTVFFGGAAEMRISTRTKLTFDVGDSLVRYRPQPSGVNPSFSRHNLRLEIGFSVGFGHPVAPR